MLWCTVSETFVGTSFPRNASVVLAGPSSSSSFLSSFHMTAKTPGKYVIPVRFFIQNTFFPQRWPPFLLRLPILQRPPVSSASQSPAIPILQRLPVSSASRSPATPILQRLPFSSASSDYPAPPSSDLLGDSGQGKENPGRDYGATLYFLQESLLFCVFH
jgi:hypothetical protein